MRVLSLFDGMACGALALQAAGIEIESYDAFEIDKYAIKTASHNFPFIVHHGNVFEADFTKFEGVDLVCGGSPCTYWSIAQKNNRETEASGMGWELFQQYVRAIKEAKPKFFVYENNKSMSKAIRQSIDEAFGFEAVLINSALVSAQNRQRLYWVGKRNADGTYSKVDIAQPEDRGILLKDVLDGVTDREKARSVICSIGRTTEREYFIKSQGTMTFERIPEYGVKDKARPVITAYSKRGTCENQLISNAFTENQVKQKSDYIAEPVCVNSKSGRGGVDGLQPSLQDRIYSIEGKHTAVTTGFRPNIAEPVRIGSLPRPNGELSTSQAMRIYSTEGKSVNLTSGGGGLGGKTGLYAVPICHTIPQIVKVRKYTCDIEEFQKLLRDSKKKSGLTNKDIAQKFNRPQTEVEHWFRTDNCFSVPDADIWYKLKEFLNIEITEYDSFVTVFELREGVFEKSDRCYDANGKMSTLMTGGTDNIIVPICYAIPVEFDGDIPTKAKSGADGKIYRVYEVKDGLITIKGKQYEIDLEDGFYIIRKLTVSECKRLQTVPEWYEFPVSDSQAYKMLGNGWTVDVIAHIFTHLKAGDYE